MISESGSGCSEKDLIGRLNTLQREAFDSVFGPLIVMAPAGTGKTDVIALRAYHACEQGVDPKRMILMTFTNRAARSMRQRLREIVGEKAEQMHISTFHGLCAHILREEAENLSIARDFVILDEEDVRLILREILSQRRLARGLYYNEERFIIDFLRLAREYPYIHEGRLDLREYFSLLIQERRMSGSFGWFRDVISEVFYEYRRQLRSYGMMDFTSLVTGVLSAFENPSIQKRWSNRFDWMELDEIQDTNQIEYQIIRHLYERHHNIGIFGDLHQTIYEWRGSVPNDIIRHFKLNNPGCKELRFEENYRSTKTILCAAEGFLTFETAKKSQQDQGTMLQDGLIKVRGFKKETEEEKYIAKKIKEFKNQGHSYHSMAVLTRTNKEAGKIGAALAREGIPIFLMEKTRFFSREEIKNALAYLKLMLNPQDILSLKRINREVTEHFLMQEKKYALSIEDMLLVSNYRSHDPYDDLMETFDKNDLIVFDVETTGLDVKSNQVIQIAALRGGKDGVSEKFERFIQIEGSVGDSYSIHRISDEYLKEHGIKAQTAFSDFIDFVGTSPVLGHNVRYDQSIVTANMTDLGMNAPFTEKTVYDSLILSRKIYPGFRSYSLENLFSQLGLAHRPTHNAMDDVIATLQLVEMMVKKLRDETQRRKALFTSYENRFYPIARNLNYLSELSQSRRPQDIMHEALIKSGFLAEYQQRQEELEKLRELYRIFREYDDESISTLESISFLLEIASLGNDTDRMLRLKEQVPVITVHQSKGLEFESVFIYGATDDSFPSLLSKDERSLKEERRLFYVAITRPKKNLFLTYHVGENNEYMPSRFIHQIERKYLDYR